jgi:hypothetical protein
MPDPSGLPSSVQSTYLLKAWGQGDEEALSRLMPLVAAELHRLAHRYMSREKPAHTLQTTGLETRSISIWSTSPKSAGRIVPIFRHFGAHDAPYPDRLCPVTQLSETRRGGVARLLG